MSDGQNLKVTVALAYQIKGLGETVTELQLSIVFDNSIVPKEDTNVIVNARLYVVSQTEPIQVTQQLPESSIIRGVDGAPNILPLEGILYIRTSYLEGMQTAADLYYCT